MLKITNTEMRLNPWTLRIEKNDKADKELTNALLETTRSNLPWIIGFFLSVTIVFVILYVFTLDSNSLYYTLYNCGCLVMFATQWACTHKFIWLSNAFCIISFLFVVGFYYYGQSLVITTGEEERH
jgi:hypothetical protein